MLSITVWAVTSGVRRQEHARFVEGSLQLVVLAKNKINEPNRKLIKPLWCRCSVADYDAKHGIRFSFMSRGLIILLTSCAPNCYESSRLVLPF